MPIGDWRILGVFGAALIAVSFIDGRLAKYLVAVLAAVVFVKNAGRIATWAGNPKAPNNGDKGGLR